MIANIPLIRHHYTSPETLEAAIRSLENLLSKRLNIFKKHVWSGPIF